MAYTKKKKTAETADEKLLKRIRERYDYMVEAWKPIRDEAEKDLIAQSVDGPWLSTERAERKANNRPCIHLDQLGQHSNNLVNEVRLNPISIKVEPRGGGATNPQALLRSERIRAIEHDTNAKAARQTAFENAVTRSYGVWGITIAYQSWDSRRRIIKYRRFANPDAVLWDPDCQEADCSDMEDAFVIERYSHEEFKRRFKGAEVTSFDSDTRLKAASWIGDHDVQVAEYWYRETVARTVLFTSDGKRYFKDELGEGVALEGGHLTLGDGSVLAIVEERDTEEVKIKQCLTNGVEILDETDWPGKWIPIIPTIGREKYIRVGGKVQRVLESYIRQAIAGQMLFDYYVSNEAEAVGRVPKMPYEGAEGQFDTNTDWANIGKSPVPYVEFKVTTEATGNQVLPMPRYNAYEPPVQALNIGKEAARRAIQAAMGSYGATRQDDTNVKSGVALEELKQQSDMGAYHFVDNYKIALAHDGRIVNDLLDDVEGREQIEVGVRDEMGEPRMVKLNQPNEKGEIQSYRLTDEDQFDVTISTGKSYESQRAEDAEVADILMQNPNTLPIVGDLAVLMRNPGPLGTKMAERLKALHPPGLPGEEQEGQPQIPPEIMQQIQQMEAALNDAMQQLEQHKAGIPKLQADMQMKMAELQSKERLEQQKLEVEMMKIRADVAIAMAKNESNESQTLLQAETDRIGQYMDVVAAQTSQRSQFDHDREARQEAQINGTQEG